MSPLVRCGSVAMSLWAVIFRYRLAIGSGTSSRMSAHVRRRPRMRGCRRGTKPAVPARERQHGDRLPAEVFDRSERTGAEMCADLALVSEERAVQTTALLPVGTACSPSSATSCRSGSWPMALVGVALRDAGLVHDWRSVESDGSESCRPDGGWPRTTSVDRRCRALRSSRRAVIRPPGPPPTIAIRVMSLPALYLRRDRREPDTVFHPSIRGSDASDSTSGNVGFRDSDSGVLDSRGLARDARLVNVSAPTSDSAVSGSGEFLRNSRVRAACSPWPMQPRMT